MKMKSMVLFAVALGFGTVAMLGVQKALSKGGPKKDDSIKVLVAAVDLQPGVPLDATNSTFKSWPKSSVPEGAVTKPEQYENRSLLAPAVAGEMILQGKLGEPGFHSLTRDIPEGMRVVTVPVDATKTHSGLMMPGNRVDVVVTYKSRNKLNTIISKTKTVLENIKVFATDNRRDLKGVENAEANAAKNISLLVTPDQGNLVMLAQNKGTLHLALRRDGDETEGNAAPVDEDAFEDAAIGVGSSDGEMTDEEGSPEGGNVRQFLEKSQGKSDKTAEAPAATDTPDKPKWKVTIYAGGEAKEVEIDIPEEPKVVPTSTSPSAEAGGSGGAEAKDMLKGMIFKFFAGA